MRCILPSVTTGRRSVGTSTIRSDRTDRWIYDTHALNFNAVIFLSLPNDMLLPSVTSGPRRVGTLTIRTDRTDRWLYDTHALNINAVISLSPLMICNTPSVTTGQRSVSTLTIRTDRTDLLTLRYPRTKHQCSYFSFFISLPNDMQYTICQLWPTERKHT